MRISKQFWEAVKTANRPAYKIAQEAGVHPNWLSKILNGIQEVEYGDLRVIKLGALLGLKPSECLTKDED